MSARHLTLEEQVGLLKQELEKLGGQVVTQSQGLEVLGLAKMVYHISEGGQLEAVNCLYSFDASNGDLAVVLPRAEEDGQDGTSNMLMLKHAKGCGGVRVQAQPGQTIDGEAELVLLPGDSLVLKDNRDGTWLIIAGTL